jgi:hypothetical protein
VMTDEEAMKTRNFCRGLGDRIERGLR